MRHPLIARLVLMSVLAAPIAVLAQQPSPQEYGGRTEMTEAVREAAKARAMNNIHSYSKDKAFTAKVAPFPWKAVGLMVLVFGVAAAFAIPYFRKTVREGQDAEAQPPGFD